MRSWKKRCACNPELLQQENLDLKSQQRTMHDAMLILKFRVIDHSRRLPLCPSVTTGPFHAARHSPRCCARCARAWFSPSRRFLLLLPSVLAQNIRDFATAGCRASPRRRFRSAALVRFMSRWKHTIWDQRRHDSNLTDPLWEQIPPRTQQGFSQVFA